MRDERRRDIHESWADESPAATEIEIAHTLLLSGSIQSAGSVLDERDLDFRVGGQESTQPGGIGHGQPARNRLVYAISGIYPKPGVPLADWFQRKGQPARELWRAFNEPTDNILPGTTHLPCKASVAVQANPGLESDPLRPLSASDLEAAPWHTTRVPLAAFADASAFA
jgi:hypothetical protein